MPLSTVKHDDHHDHCNQNDGDDQDRKRGSRDGLARNKGFIKAREILGDTGENVDDKDHGNTVAHALFRHLLADPHQVAGACCEAYHNCECLREIHIRDKSLITEADSHCDGFEQ